MKQTLRSINTNTKISRNELRQQVELELRRTALDCNKHDVKGADVLKIDEVLSKSEPCYLVGRK